ncbi:MAG TPA: (Fe-S)-binding protein [Candidatus Eisenbacteria bacterium]|nr:(Fe-S)-binding protein [Candidatus Eisenbacteria bacterium]
MARKTPIPGETPTFEDFSLCIHCGLCLNHCPTYRLWKLEADSPRGRIRQMLLVNQGELAVSSAFVHHIDTCLDCRSCETACPSAINYGKLVEHARARIETEYRRPLLSCLARNFVYRRLLPYPERIAMAAALLRFYQSSGLQALARSTGVLKMLGLAARELLLPPIDEHFFFDQLGKTYPAKGNRRARVAFFAGCIANVTFSALNQATIRVLTANGCEVVIPGGQFCCGALPLHAGVRDVARSLARRNLASFASGDFDSIVTNAAGCGATLKEYGHLFAPNELEHAAAAAFTSKVRDVTEFLADFGLSAPLKPVTARVTYQDSCHLLHGQKIREAPRLLLKAIPGLELVELPFADICCGSAGVYNVTQTEASLDLLAEKMGYAKSTGAQIIATANPGCLLQLRAGVELHKTGQEVLHVVELLDRAFAGGA